MAITSLDQMKSVAKMKKVFVDAVDYAHGRRKHGAYTYLDTPKQKQALRHVAKELVIGNSTRTGLLVVDGSLFKIEPIFDNNGKYILEEVIYLGALDNVDLSYRKISKDLF